MRRFKLIWVVQSPTKNIPLVPSGKSPALIPASCTRKRGVSRSSRTLGAGCGGRRRRCWRERRPADGEAVWSWRPDAGVKLAERSASDGGKKARSPRRARY